VKLLKLAAFLNMQLERGLGSVPVRLMIDFGDGDGQWEAELNDYAVALGNEGRPKYLVLIHESEPE